VLSVRVVIAKSALGERAVFGLPAGVRSSKALMPDAWREVCAAEKQRRLYTKARSDPAHGQGQVF
jgi:hypothetical protein